MPWPRRDCPKSRQNCSKQPEVNAWKCCPQRLKRNSLLRMPNGGRILLFRSSHWVKKKPYVIQQINNRNCSCDGSRIMAQQWYELQALCDNEYSGDHHGRPHGWRACISTRMMPSQFLTRLWSTTTKFNLPQHDDASSTEFSDDQFISTMLTWQDMGIVRCFVWWTSPVVVHVREK